MASALVAALQQQLLKPDGRADDHQLLQQLASWEEAYAAADAPALEQGELKQLVAALCSCLNAHEQARTATSCEAQMLSILVGLLGHDAATDDIAVQKGLLTATTGLLRSSGGNPAVANSCLHIVATLSAVESSDKTIERLETVQLVVESLRTGQDEAVLEAAVTTLAALAKRARHRRTLGHGDCIVVLAHKLNQQVGRCPSFVVAASRFVISYALKEDGRLAVLHNGGVLALMAAFNWLLQGGQEAQESAEPCATVAAALWACCSGCQQVQDTLFSADWLKSLAASLSLWPEHAGLHEAALGIVRDLSHLRQYCDDIVSLGFIEAAVQSLERFAEVPVLVKEACGLLGNLATDQDLRLILGQKGAVQAILAALVRCQGHDDRKIAKIAIGALLNLAACERNREELSKLQAGPVILDAARHFMDNAHISEYAAGALSHLAVHEACNRQLLDAGAVEALLLVVGKHMSEVQVVTKALVALRRLVKQAVVSGGAGAATKVAARLACQEDRGACIGVQLLVDALQQHVSNTAVVKEAATILTVIGTVSVYEFALVQLAVPPCMKALDLHQQDPAAAEAVGNFLASLPLEEAWGAG